MMTITLSYQSFLRVGAALGRHSRLLSTTVNKYTEQSTTAKPQKAEKNFTSLQRIRPFSTLNSKSTSIVFDKEMKKKYYDVFNNTFSEIERDVIEIRKQKGIDDTEWLTEILHHSVAGGKKIRGFLCVVSYILMEDPKKLTPENLHRACIMGWIIEIFQGVCIIFDDIMDESLTRRGVQCWYKRDDKGVIAINDSFQMYALKNILLDKYFHDQHCYKDIYKIFYNIELRSVFGEYLDLQTTTGLKPDLSKFTTKRFSAVAKLKTSCYTFQLPINLAMAMCGIKDPDLFRQADDIVFDIGHFYQAQDDFLDCFGDPNVSGKIGTDIQTGKCTWLAVAAMEKANTEQKRLMEKYYGSNKDEDVAKIKDLYEKLELRKAYQNYELTSYNMIQKRIQQASGVLPSVLFENLLENIYKRNR